ncbi:Uncharacterised protein [Actinomyces bovis]|uniref:Telomeric repeat-binding factor 2 n=1 Tax=Actinomyces bovis TaxID=1658 RepID=A0ABY1VQQ1_9ACTO|nr:hypothetical protein [Actinomyces bovis]SPT54128.1 Uncharacterised protein [Actinomyces bovis]VEG53627.1 Uncharacterised protein [Actinomyces israelii]
MALRFNPPPNWPAPPEGFVPPAGWQPDPAWGPAPEGWQLWVDDAMPAADASGVAPTQAIALGSPAPGSPSVGSAPSFEGGAPSVGSAPSFGASAASVGSAPAFGASAPSVGSAPAFNTTPLGSSAPVAGSAPSSSPYAANLDYAQAPTPYHSAPGQPQVAGWQPVDVSGAGQAAATPVTKQWWFWALIVGVVAALVLVAGLVYAMSGDDDPKPVSQPSNSTSSEPDPTTEPSEDPAPPTQVATVNPTAAPSAAPSANQSAAPKQGGDVGKTRENPIDPTVNGLTFHASKYSDDPKAYIEVQFGAVTWDATEALRASMSKYSFEDPGDGNQYMRVPVTLTYHGKGQFEKYQLTVDYVDDNASSYKAKSIYNLGGTQDDFNRMDMPRDGGSVTGNFTFVIPSGQVNKGVFAVKAFYGSDELYVKAK